MRRVPWAILLALFAGLGLGVVYSWMIAPRGAVDTKPTVLRADFKDQYRGAIAASFAATGNLPRAQARLSLIGDPDSIEALNSQAQRMIASGEFTQADQLAALALALENGYASFSVPTPTLESLDNVSVEPSITLPPPPPSEDLPFQFTETPELVETPIVETQAVVDNPTPRPTRTLIPTVGAPFALIAQDTVCDTNFPDGLLQVIVFNSRRRQVAGAKIIIAWENGQEEFFTGLKPEIGNGYADFSMSPNVTYALRLAAGSDIAAGLVAPTCQTPGGEDFLGGVKLTFQQP